MKYILILILSVLLHSCFVTQKQRVRICNDCKVVQIDSIYIKDTIVNIESDSAYFEALLECDSLGNIRFAEINELEGKIVGLETSLKHNRIKIVAKTDTIKIHVPGVIEYKYRTVVQEKTVFKEYWWKWPLLILSGFTSVFFVISNRSLIFKFIKNLI